MNNKKRLMISLITIVGVICILVGSIAYYRITVSGSIKGSTGNAVFNVTGFTDETTKEIVLKEGLLVPGDKGSFTLSLDATDSDVDMYVTLSIDRGTLPTNLKFYTTSDYKSELHKYYEFMDTSNQSKDITIYWYWNPYIDDAEDSNFINNTDLTATIKLDAVQISEYAMMKNGNSSSSSSRIQFWSDTYRPYIRTIKFDNDLSNLPSSCTGNSDLCWNVSYYSTQNKKVYAYLIDSGLDYIDTNSVSHDLYNLYIVSEAPIFAPSDCYAMFRDFTNLISIDFNNNFNTSKVTNMWSMFYNCSSLEKLNLSSFNTSKVTEMIQMFSYCSSLKNLDLSNFNTSNVRMNSMFSYCSSLKSLDLSSFNTSSVTDMSYMFSNCSSLENLNLSSFNTSKVRNMSWMFRICSSLKSLDLSSFNTLNVTDMGEMFYRCSSLKSLDLSNFNTSKVTTMYRMFGICLSLTSLDLSSFNTLNVTDMGEMFYNCSSLENLNLSSFNTSKVTTMYRMFACCYRLTSLDLSSFNTSNVTNMCCMFDECSSLTSLDLSSFNTSNVTNMGSMFYGCSKLTTTINIMGTGVTEYGVMFKGAATSEGAQITVNYIADASTLVDNMIATKSSTSNVVKGVEI